MKLLSPTQVRDTKAQEASREILRTNELNGAADKARKNLANAEADFQQMLAGQQARWAREQGEWEKIVERLTKEIASLEAQKAKALEPIELIEKRAQDRLKESQELLEAAKRREAYAEELNELLQDKLDDVGDRESAVITAERYIQAQRENLKMDQDQNKTIKDKLEHDVRLWTVHKADELKELRKRKTELTLKENSIEAQRETLRKTEETLAAWDQRLKDERGTLDRIYIRTGAAKKGD